MNEIFVGYEFVSEKKNIFDDNKKVIILLQLYHSFKMSLLYLIQDILNTDIFHYP